MRNCAPTVTLLLRLPSMPRLSMLIPMACAENGVAMMAASVATLTQWL